jgi:hypothetical protein
MGKSRLRASKSVPCVANASDAGVVMTSNVMANIWQLSQILEKTVYFQNNVH